MNRNSLLLAAAVVAAVVGGVFLARRLRQRNLPEGKMTQTSPPPQTVAVASPIPGRPQVQITTTSGSAIVELRPDIDNAAVANLLAKLSRGECVDQTTTDCGLINKNFIQVISGQLPPDAKISSAFILGK